MSSLKTMDIKKKLPAFLTGIFRRIAITNKFILVSAFFLIWISFFDKNRLITQYQLSQTIERLEDDRRFYEEKIAEAKIDRVDIEVNKEKYARERYYMHLPDEEVFIIER